jgi:hypothetical protein
MDNCRREFSRISLQLEVCLRLEDGSEIRGEGTDLSLRGVFCETAETVPAGTLCKVKLLFDTGDNTLEFEAAGRVARATEPGLALEFTGLEIESYHHLRNLIRLHAPDPDVVDHEFATHVGLKRREEADSATE